MDFHKYRLFVRRCFDHLDPVAILQNFFYRIRYTNVVKLQLDFDALFEAKIEFAHIKMKVSFRLVTGCCRIVVDYRNAEVGNSLSLTAEM